MAWFSFRASNYPGMYGCQLTFNKIFNAGFTLANLFPKTTENPTEQNSTLTINPQTENSTEQNSTFTINPQSDIPYLDVSYKSGSSNPTPTTPNFGPHVSPAPKPHPLFSLQDPTKGFDRNAPTINSEPGTDWIFGYKAAFWWPDKNNSTTNNQNQVQGGTNQGEGDSGPDQSITPGAISQPDGKSTSGQAK